MKKKITYNELMEKWEVPDNCRTCNLFDSYMLLCGNKEFDCKVLKGDTDDKKNNTF